MPSPSPVADRIRAAAEVLELAPAHVAALLALASVACAGLVGLWWTARPARTAAVPPVLATSAPTVAPGAATTPPAAVSVADEVVVHVSGAVASEGVVELPAGARVVDALDAVGGARRAARTDQLNLARPIRDGEQVHVPTAREALITRSGPAAGETTASPGVGAVGSAGAKADGSAAATVNLNQATATELEALPGVGPVLAARLVEHRDATGGFTSVDELLEVEGIGEKTLAELRDHVSL